MDKWLLSQAFVRTNQDSGLFTVYANLLNQYSLNT